MAVVSDASAATIEDFLEKLGCSAETEEGHQLMEAIRSDRWRSYGRAAKDTHPRSYDKDQQIEDRSHIEALTERKRQARRHRGHAHHAGDNMFAIYVRI